MKTAQENAEQPRPRTMGPLGLAYALTGGKYKPVRHASLICKELMLAAGGHNPRLLLQLPIGHAKTTYASIFFPFWYMGTFPDRKIIGTSNTDDLATDCSIKVRDLMEEHGPRLFGLTVRRDKRGAHAWQLTDLRGVPTGGEYRCAGVGGSIMGFRADLFLTDDLVKNAEQASSPSYRDKAWSWYKSVAERRCKPDAAIINIGTPWNTGDIHGRLLTTQDQGGFKWRVVRLPALSEGMDGPSPDPLGRPEGEPLWPEEWSLEKLKAIQEDLRASGEYRLWHSLYQLKPLAGDGLSSWPNEYFNDHIWCEEQQVPTNIVRSVLAIDTSKGESRFGDFQAFVYTRLDDDGHFWIDSFLCRLDDVKLEAQATQLISLWNPDVTVVETNGSGYVLFNALGRKRINGQYQAIIGRYHHSKENKHNRIENRLTAPLARGILHFLKSPGCRLTVSQARDFPNSDFDDGPDGLEMALELHRELLLPKNQRRIRYQVPKRAVA